MSGYKLMVMGDDKYTFVRYRRKGETQFRTVQVKGSDIDSIIEELMNHLKVTYENDMDDSESDSSSNSL